VNEMWITGLCWNENEERDRERESVMEQRSLIQGIEDYIFFPAH
jgi:hypothetical protein